MHSHATSRTLCLHQGLAPFCLRLAAWRLPSLALCAKARKSSGILVRRNFDQLLDESHPQDVLANTCLRIGRASAREDDEVGPFVTLKIVRRGHGRNCPKLVEQLDHMGEAWQIRSTIILRIRHELQISLEVVLKECMLVMNACPCTWSGRQANSRILSCSCIPRGRFVINSDDGTM